MDYSYFRTKEAHTGYRAKVWNSSFYRVEYRPRGRAHTVIFSTGLAGGSVTTSVDRTVSSLIIDATDGVEELRLNLDLKENQINPDANAFVEGDGKDVRFTYNVTIFAENAEQAATIQNVFGKILSLKLV